MTIDKDIFLEKRDNDEMPLYEGKMINQFDSNFSESQYFVNEESLKEKLFSKEVYRMVDNLYNDDVNNKLKDKNKLGKENRIMEYLGIDKKEEFSQYIVYDYTFPRLAFRDIASNTNERTLISAIIPPEVTAGNTLWLSNAKKYYLDNKDICSFQKAFMG